MRNQIVATGVFGPVYRRKIHIHYKNELTGGEWRYCYSTNAARTCSEARDRAAPNFPNSQVKATFAKD